MAEARKVRDLVGGVVYRTARLMGMNWSIALPFCVSVAPRRCPLRTGSQAATRQKFVPLLAVVPPQPGEVIDGQDFPPLDFVYSTGS